MKKAGFEVIHMNDEKTVKRDHDEKMPCQEYSASEDRPSESADCPPLHHHRHVHSDQEKKAVINRLSRAIGHLDKVKRMVDQDADCSEVLIQLAAVRNAVNNTGKLILKNHLEHCIVHALEDGDMEEVHSFNHAVEKFIK